MAQIPRTPVCVGLLAGYCSADLMFFPFLGQFFEDANLPAAEQKKMSLRAVREQFARFQGDVGSSEVQGEALLWGQSSVGRSG
jgi:hypothetical protein